MIMFVEQIEPPPPLPMTNEKQLESKIEALVLDDIWVRNLIDGLAGDLRDVKH